MREIVSGIWMWSWLSPPHGYDFNGYLLTAAGGNICIDPVEPTPEAEAEIRRLGVSTIALTNRNHVRAANRLREWTGARTLIHAADAEYARGQGAIIDATFAAGTTIVPLEVVGVPGKSPGEVALLWRERRILVVGDAIIGNPPGRCSLLREKVMDDPPRLRQSVRQLLDLDFDTLLVGDGVPIVVGAKTAVRTLTEEWPAA